MPRRCAKRACDNCAIKSRACFLQGDYAAWVRTGRDQCAIAARGGCKPPLLELVTLAAGFGNLSHFHRCFRAVYGVTPAQYRKQHQRNIL